MENTTGFKKISASNWIALRMMFLLFAYDPSMHSHPEVQKAKKYYKNVLGFTDNDWEYIILLLAHDNAIQKNFLATGVQANRNLANSITLSRQTND